MFCYNDQRITEGTAHVIIHQLKLNFSTACQRDSSTHTAATIQPHIHGKLCTYLFSAVVPRDKDRGELEAVSV